jgi:hypothetical protein
MAFLESDRVQIRQYLGFGALFLQLDNRLESAINSIQSIADGGTRPDSSSEVALKAIVTKLQAVDSAIDALSVQQGAHEVDEIKLDSARETLRLRMVGRQYVGRLARMLDTAPRSDCFATVPTLYGPDPRSGY